MVKVVKGFRCQGSAPLWRKCLKVCVPVAAVSEIAVNIKGYKSVWEFSLDTYQLHLRYILLDSVTGYRSQYHSLSTLINL